MDKQALIDWLLRSDVSIGYQTKRDLLGIEDILRALDYFQEARVPYDPRMQEALEVLLKKKTKDGRWKLQQNHLGKFHFHMEKVGKESRWNTLRALRVLDYFYLS